MERPGRILIVDDDDLGRRVLAAIVASLGHQVTAAASGEEALHLLSLKEYDIVLLDLIMPGIGGYVTLERIRQGPVKDLPVIVISGVEGMEAVVRSIDMGATDYLQKPVDRTLLRARLDSSLLSKRLRDREREHLREMQRVQARLEAVIGNSPIGIVLLDMDGMIVEANDAFIDMLKTDLKNIVGTPYSGFCEKDDLHCAEDIERFLSERQKGVFRREANMRTREGGAFTIQSTMTLVRDQEEQPIFGMIMVEDISERKLAREALQESEKNFRTFFETMTDIIVVGTPEGRILYCNEAAVRKLGYSAEEFAGMHVLDMHPREVREEAEGIFTAMFNGERDSCPLPLARKDGSYIPVDTRAWPGRWDGEDCIFGISKDLTAEQEAQQRFERLFRSNPAPMALSTIPGQRFSDVNDAFLKVLGYSRDEIIGRTAEEIGLFAQVEDREKQTRAVTDLMADGRVAGFEIDATCKNGSIINGIFSGELIDDHGAQSLLTVMVDITERKRAEMVLRESEERIRILMNSTAEAIYGLDMKGNCTFCNDSCLRLLGYQHADELLGKNMHWMIHSKYADGTHYPVERCRIFQAFAVGKGTHVDDEVLWRSDGTSFWAEYWSYPQFHDGVIVGAVVTFLDITERKLTREALQLSEARFREIFNSVNDAIHLNIPGPDLAPGAFVDINEVGCRMLGYSREEMMNMTPMMFTTEHHQPCIEEILRTLREEGTVNYQTEHRRRDGVLFPVEVNARTVRMLGRSMILAVVRDITERKRDERALQQSVDALRQSEETLRLVVASAPFPLLIADRDGTYIVDANEKAVAAFNLDMGQGHTLASLFTDASSLKKIMEDMEVRGSIENMEISLHCKEEMWVMLSVRMMSFQGEERLLLATYDISERRRMERALQQASAKLGMLNSITRHDIINQMLVLSGFLELCRLREKDPSLAAYLAKMAQASENVQKQIAFTREYQDIGVRAPAWASVGRQTTNAFEMLHPEGVKLIDDSGGLEILADPLAEKVPYNLIDNSMRHGERVARIRVSTEPVGDAMLIVYEDDGVGISSGDKKRLFEKGFGKNTGFGLFLTREILAITGITIEEKGESGQGVRFEMTVPPGAWRRTTPKAE